MSSRPEPEAVETRVRELCDLKAGGFRKIVLRDIDGIADKTTRAALEHPSLSYRWQRAVEVEKGKTIQQLRTLRLDKNFKDRSALNRLDAYIQALDAKLAEVEWIDKKNKMEKARQQEVVAQQKRDASERQLQRQEALVQRLAEVGTQEELKALKTAREALKDERKALAKERSALEHLLGQIQSQTGTDRAVQASCLPPKKDFKKEVLGELARRYPDEYVAILSALLTKAGVDFTEADVQLSLERVTS